MKAEDKHQLAVRVSQSALKRLRRASLLLEKSQGQIVEEAFIEYEGTHGLGGRYELRVVDGYTVLVCVHEKTTKLVEVCPLNGVPPLEVAQHYSVKMGAPVALVTQEEHDDERPVGAPPS